MSLAQDEARNLGQMYVGTEHLLLALIKEGDGIAAQALSKLDVTYDETLATVKELATAETEPVPGGHIPFTPRAKRVLEDAYRETMRVGEEPLRPDAVAIIVAGGSGERFGDPRGKQFVDLCGLPLMSWAILAFDHAPSIARIVVVCTPERTDEVASDILSRLSLRCPAAIAPAGDTRQDSVMRQMDDDFNTAGGLAAIFGLVTTANTYLAEATKPSTAPCLRAADTLAELVGVLGISVPDADSDDLPHELVDLAATYAGYDGSSTEDASAALLDARQAARETRDWSTADAIRDAIADLGLVLEDTANGARLRRA